MKIALAIVLLVLIGLVASNPSMEAFKDFAEDHSERILRRELGESGLGRALAGAGGSLVGSFIDRITERQNYLLVSFYTIDLDGEDADKDEWLFLGVAGQFIELKSPE